MQDYETDKTRRLGVDAGVPHRISTYAGQLGKETSQYTVEGVQWQAIIHVIFIMSAIGIAYVEKISQDSYAAGRKAHH